MSDEEKLEAEAQALIDKIGNVCQKQELLVIGMAFGGLIKAMSKGDEETLQQMLNLVKDVAENVTIEKEH